MNKPVLISIVGVVVVMLAISLNFVLESGDDEPVPRAGVAADRSAPPRATPAPAPTPNADAQREDAESPSFDVVRINPQGDAVIAGRAKAGTKVDIYEGDNKIGEVETDRRGEWVFVPERPLTPGNRRLSLVSRDKDGGSTPGAADVVIVVPERVKESTPALAMRVPKEGRPGAVEILQRPQEVASVPPAPTPADTGPPLSVDAVDYDAQGKLDIVGKAPPGSLVQLYLNNEFLGRAEVGARGSWVLRPSEPVSAGNYLLRADQVEAGGKVIARVEVRFARQRPIENTHPDALVVVNEGNSLWRIARRTYGSGFKYTDIYEANREHIKDPDLIYPGQVFKLPQIN